MRPCFQKWAPMAFFTKWPAVLKCQSLKLWMNCFVKDKPEKHILYAKVFVTLFRKLIFLCSFACFWPFPSVTWLWTWWFRCEWTFLDHKATIWSKTHSNAFHWNIKTQKYHKFGDVKYIFQRTVIHSPHIRCSQASHPWSPILVTWHFAHVNSVWN